MRAALIRDRLERPRDRSRHAARGARSGPAPVLRRRVPRLAEWLAGARRSRRRDRAARPPARAASKQSSPGWTRRKPRRAVDSGRRLLKLAGVEPVGFVAPGYAGHARAARDGPRALRLVGRRASRSTGPDGPAGGTAIGPALLAAERGAIAGASVAPCRDPRARAATAGRVLRLDLKPRDLENRRHVAAVERVLTAARGRVPVTLDGRRAPPGRLTGTPVSAAPRTPRASRRPTSRAGGR